MTKKLATFLLTTMSIFLGVTSIYAAELNPSKDVPQISGAETVFVSAKNYTLPGITKSKEEVKVKLSKMFTFKTNTGFKPLPDTCTFELELYHENKEYPDEWAGYVEFSLPKGWKNTSEENELIDVTVWTEYLKEESKNKKMKFEYGHIWLDEITNKPISFFETESGDGIDVSFETAKFYTHDKGDVDEYNCGILGGGITATYASPAWDLAVNGAEYPTLKTFELASAGDTSKMNNYKGSFKLTFTPYNDIDSLLVTTNNDGINVYFDKAHTRLVDSFVVYSKNGVVKLDTTLYYEVLEAFVEKVQDYGETSFFSINGKSFANGESIDDYYTGFYIDFITKKTNVAYIKMDKTELKNFTGSGNVKGKIIFNRAVSSDISVNLELLNNVSGVSVPATVAVKKDKKESESFTITLTDVEANSFILSASLDSNIAKQQNIKGAPNDDSDYLIDEEHISLSYIEENSFLETKDVTLVPSAGKKVKVTFKLKQAVAGTVTPKWSTTDDMPGIDSRAVKTTIDAGEKTFSIEFEVKDPAVIKPWVYDDTIVTVEIPEADSANAKMNRTWNRSQYLEQCRVFVKDIVTPNVKADFVLVAIDGKTPTENVILRKDSEVTIGFEFFSKSQDSTMKALVNERIKDGYFYVNLKLDKAAEQITGMSSRIEGWYSASRKLEFDVEYCASKIINGSITATIEGVSMGVKKLKFKAGGDLNLDPYAIAAGKDNSIFYNVNGYKDAMTKDFYIYGNTIEVINDDVHDIYIEEANTDTQAAIVKTYIGTGVAKNDAFKADKTIFIKDNAEGEKDTSLIVKAPALSFYVCDPITNPNELKKAKKFALIAPKTIDPKSEKIDYIIKNGPITYNKKALATARNQGKFFCEIDSKVMTTIQPKNGCVGGGVKVAWKQGKKNEPGYADYKEGDDISYIVFSAPTIDSIYGTALFATTDSKVFDFAKHKDSGMTIKAGKVNISGLYINEKTVVGFEYKDDTKVKYIAIDPVLTATQNKDDVTISFEATKDLFSKLSKIKDKEFYLVIDNGTGLVSEKIKVKIDSSLF